MKNTIICAIIGDVIGSIYEWDKIKTSDFVVDRLPSEFIEIINKFVEQYSGK